VANIRSALKRMRQNEKRRLRNRMVRSRVRTTVKRARVGLAQKSDDVRALVKEAVRTLDQAVSKGVMHKNTAARQKSALASRLASLG